MTEELKSIKVRAKDYERYMAICEVYPCCKPEEYLGFMLDMLNYPSSAEEILKGKL